MGGKTPWWSRTTPLEKWNLKQCNFALLRNNDRQPHYVYTRGGIVLFQERLYLVVISCMWCWALEMWLKWLGNWIFHFSCLNTNSHTWLVATTLDNTNPDRTTELQEPSNGGNTQKQDRGPNNPVSSTKCRKREKRDGRETYRLKQT